MIPSPPRLFSIDILRALTMILMIFVNDQWTLKNIPAWLGHVERGVDGIGLADVVFPAFLFIVGLSLPIALDARRSKGDGDLKLFVHILVRSLGLIVMGVFLVNGENFDAQATGLPSYVWYPLCCMLFIIVWNSYPKSSPIFLIYGLKALGIFGLLLLAFFYRGKSNDGSIAYFAPQWWGILGLIGWSYLAGGLVTILARNKISIMVIAWAFFASLSVASHAGFIPSFLSFIPDAILGGTLAGLTVGGALTSLILQLYKNENRRLTISLILISIFLIALSLITRPYWGLAKLGATPAWLSLCSAFTILAFLAVHWLVDIKHKSSWFAIIRSAGTGTLLCYFIPYFLYAFFAAFSIQLPEYFLVGGVGLFKSFLFALFCSAVTGWLMKIGVHLKL
jgi:heparan-alpha-glucosaminide N-acetyltransferase